MESEGQRLQTFLSQAGKGSRRGIVEVIESGHVTVNGVEVRLPGTRVLPTDQIYLDGELVTQPDSHIYLVLNKPPGFLCANKDDRDRALALELFKDVDRPSGLHHVGRLDQFSEGLIFYTTDGDFTKILTHASYGVSKRYQITTQQEIPDVLLQDFKKGLTIEGVRYVCTEALRISPVSAEITLLEGKNREIRRVFDLFQLTILKLIRVAIGSIEIGSLKTGKYRHLSPVEVSQFKKLIPQGKPQDDHHH